MTIKRYIGSGTWPRCVTVRKCSNLNPIRPEPESILEFTVVASGVGRLTANRFKCTRRTWKLHKMMSGIEMKLEVVPASVLEKTTKNDVRKHPWICH